MPANNPQIPGNLPTPISAFIGRIQEIESLHQLLSEQRLLTLTGPGGAGKTRLALKLVDTYPEQFEDGIWFIELASLSIGALLPQAIADVLGIRKTTELDVNATLIRHLKSRQALLILDNCEHLVEACAQLSASLLEACPQVHILATSRELLGVTGETVWVVPPLSLPKPQPWHDPVSAKQSHKAFLESEAIQLFEARAKARAPSFTLSEENGLWVADICRRLDGMPLAIELAAARLHAFSSREIAERLDDRFAVLTSRMRTTPERHQTLAAALDWSFALLSEQEQQLLAHLSVFAGSFDIAAAQAISAGTGIESNEVPDLIASLVDKSLVVAERYRDTRRYRLLETIRQYGADRIKLQEEITELRDCHLMHYLEWAEANSPALEGANQFRMLEQFSLEYDNLRAALEWCQENDQLTHEHLRLTAACGYYWRLKGYFNEGTLHLSAALERPKAQMQTKIRGDALLRLANISYLQTDLAQTRAWTEEALEISKTLGAEGRRIRARSHELLGEMATEVGDYEKAPAYFEEALSIFRDLGEERGMADMLMQLGWAAMRQGDYPAAHDYLQECLPMFRKLSGMVHLGFILSGLGELAIRQNDFGEAQRWLTESLDLRRELGDPWGLAASLGSLGWLALLQRDFKGMRDFLAQSLAIRSEIQEPGGTAWCLEKLAEAVVIETRTLSAAHRREHARKAVLIFGAAQALRRPLDSVIDPADQPNYEALLDELRELFGADAFTKAWQSGNDQPLEQVVALALEPLQIDELPTSELDQIVYAGLTPREREAASLVAQGLSNREIADAMVIGAKTAETYVSRILQKLAFTSRTQIARWAIEVGLSDLDDPAS
jgi:non-specific serine/threonine protein kinase